VQLWEVGMLDLESEFVRRLLQHTFEVKEPPLW
jgi:hypothetical protein